MDNAHTRFFLCAKESTQIWLCECSRRYLLSLQLLNNPIHTTSGDPMFNQVQKITARAGSLIGKWWYYSSSCIVVSEVSLQTTECVHQVWSSEQPHCNYPNDSDRFRINQYIKMFPAQEGGPNTNVRADTIKQMLPKNFQVSELGMKLLGLKSWKDTWHQWFSKFSLFNLLYCVHK